MPKDKFLFLSVDLYPDFGKSCVIIKLNRDMGTLGKVITFYLGLTDWCNLACRMCPQQFFRKEKRIQGFLPPRMLDLVFNSQLQEVLSQEAHLFLMWLGESTLYPFWDKLIQKLSQYKKFYSKVVLYTNGIFLKPIDYLLDNLGDFPVQLIFSLDAASPEIYYKIKGKNLYKKVIANVLEILSWVKVRKHLEVSLQFLVMEENKEEVFRFRNFWKEQLENLSLDYGIVSDFSLEEYNKNRINIVYRRTTMENMEYSNELYLTTLEKLNLRPHTRYLVDEMLVTGENCKAEENEMKKICPAPFRNLTINWDGRVTFCCYDTHLQIDLGSLKEEKLANIWRGDKANLVRRGFLLKENSKLPLVCQSCLSFDAPPLTEEEQLFWRNKLL